MIVLLFCFSSLFSYEYYHGDVTREVLVYYGNNDQFNHVFDEVFSDYNITFKKIGVLDSNNEKTHIILDAFLVPFKYFPKNYILFQTIDFDETPLTEDYFNKITNAVAVWDPNVKNISKYSLLCKNYYYFDKKYADPLILPCLIDPNALTHYKEMLIYSNTRDTDISSHLPTLFSHYMLKKPKIVVECGVRTGESSYAFKQASEFFSSRLIGVDINEDCSEAYKCLNIKNAEIVVMDDLQFSDWWNQSKYRNKKADVIFIDTSHFYEHTLQELEILLPILHQEGVLIFHDTNQAPIYLNTYERINRTFGRGWDNKKGVVRAIKDYFSITFDESKYTQLSFSCQNSEWSLLHYPYCNGLTVIKRLGIEK